MSCLVLSCHVFLISYAYCFQQQILEDGILTDGKGRTVSFKNTILVMTSNVGSKRILEVSREDPLQAMPTRAPVPVPKDTSLEATRAAVESSQASSDAPEPLKPQEVLERMQNNPEAAQLMLEASQDPVIMKAMRTAMDGSPAQLLEAGRENPAVAKFLQRLWAIMDTDGTITPPSPINDNASSGLGAIRSAVEASTEEWNEPAREDFSTGLIKQLESQAETRFAEMMDADERNNALYPKYMDVVTEALEAQMRPELLNRIDEIIVFSPLSQNDLANIADLIMQKTIERAEKELKGMEILVQPNLLERVVHEGSSNAAQFGARPMRRAAQRFLEDGVSDAIIQGFLQEGDCAEIDVVPGSGLDEIVVKRRRDGKTMSVIVEDGHGGIGRGKRPATTLNGESSTQAQTQAIQA